MADEGSGMTGLDAADLVGWLRQQVDKDERLARESAAEPYNFYADGHYGAVSEFLDVWSPVDPARVLAEVESKRLLIDAILRYEAKIDGEWGCCHSAEDIGAGRCPDPSFILADALKALALAYRDREGYRPEWAP